MGKKPEKNRIYRVHPSIPLVQITPINDSTGIVALPPLSQIAKHVTDSDVKTILIIARCSKQAGA